MWSAFENQLRKYLAQNDGEIVDLLHAKFLRTNSDFRNSPNCESLLESCIKQITQNPSLVYVILNDLKTSLKLNTSKSDLKRRLRHQHHNRHHHHNNGKITQKRLPFITLSTDVQSKDKLSGSTSATNPNVSTDNHTSHHDVDDDVIIIGTPDVQSTIVSSTTSDGKRYSQGYQARSSTPKSDDSTENETGALSIVTSSIATTASMATTTTAITNISSSNNSDVRINEHKRRMIARLEQILARISQEIRELEEKELDFDALESNNSPYIQLDVLKRHYLKVWRRICELRKVACTSGRILKRRFLYNGSQYNSINSKIEEFINQKKEFPDYTDVRDIVVMTNLQNNLNLSKPVVSSLAREIFVDVGHLLKQRRQDDLRHDMGCFLTDDVCEDDPVHTHRILRNQLSENKRLGDQKLNTVFKYYVDLENTINTQDESSILETQTGLNKHISSSDGSTNDDSASSNNTESIDAAKHPFELASVTQDNIITTKIVDSPVDDIVTLSSDSELDNVDNNEYPPMLDGVIGSPSVCRTDNAFALSPTADTLVDAANRTNKSSMETQESICGDVSSDGPRPDPQYLNHESDNGSNNRGGYISANSANSLNCYQEVRHCQQTYTVTTHFGHGGYHQRTTTTKQQSATSHFVGQYPIGHPSHDHSAPPTQSTANRPAPTRGLLMPSYTLIKSNALMDRLNQEDLIEID